MSASSYHLPTVSAIRQIPPNGLKVVSTFSGGGGTCLGMMLAGYEVVWANDCDPHARETYTANLGKPIDGRLLNDVTAADILAETGLKEGELDVFEGSPPCTKFSTAGSRQKGWNRKEIHAGKVQANTEDLFFEWIRLARGLRPKVFVAENVAGLVKGASKGYFKDILKEMKSFGYRVEARLLDAKWLGVPQRRNRIIFIGVRDDLSRMPTFPKPLHRQWTVRQAIGDLLTSSSFQTEQKVDVEQIVGNDRYVPKWGNLDQTHPTLTSEGPNGSQGQMRYKNIRRHLTIPEVKRICSFPDDYVLDGSFGKQWARLGNAVPPMMAYHIARAIRTGVFCRGVNGRIL